MFIRRLLPVIALLCVAATPEALRQPTGAMEPTLLVGDNFLVEELGAPELGLVIVMAVGLSPDHRIFPASQRPDLKHDYFIKRIVALGGSTVAIKNGVLLVNGRAVPTEETGKTYTDINGRTSRVLRQVLGTREFKLLDSPDSRPDFEEIVVPSAHVFVLGDNRDFSRDSRSFGPFPLADVVGRVGRVYASVDPGTGEVRPERLDTEVN